MVRGFGLSFLKVVVGALDVYFWIVVARAVLSWVSPDPRNPIVRALVAVTEPALRPFRRLVPPHRLGGVDLSPLFLLLLIEFVKNGLVYSFGFRPRFF